MKSIIATVAAGLLLTACATKDVTNTCQEAAAIASMAQPFMVAASPEIQTVVMLLGAGAVACGTPEYAGMRDLVLGFLSSQVPR